MFVSRCDVIKSALQFLAEIAQLVEQFIRNE